jgi:8-oxo-dGTP diphosphatase
MTGMEGNSEETHDVVAALLVRDERVLLCHRSAARQWYPDVWDLPGGHVESGETPSQALARELEEELGVAIGEPGSELLSVREDGLTMTIWLIERWAGDPVNALPAEHDAVGWFSVPEIADLPLAHSGYLAFIKETLTRLRHEEAS